MELENIGSVKNKFPGLKNVLIHRSIKNLCIIHFLCFPYKYTVDKEDKKFFYISSLSNDLNMRLFIKRPPFVNKENISFRNRFLEYRCILFSYFKKNKDYNLMYNILLDFGYQDLINDIFLFFEKIYSNKFVFSYFTNINGEKFYIQKYISYEFFYNKQKKPKYDVIIRNLDNNSYLGVKEVLKTVKDSELMKKADKKQLLEIILKRKNKKIYNQSLRKSFLIFLNKKFYKNKKLILSSSFGGINKYKEDILGIKSKAFNFYDRLIYSWDENLKSNIYHSLNKKQIELHKQFISIGFNNIGKQKFYSMCLSIYFLDSEAELMRISSLLKEYPFVFKSLYSVNMVKDHIPADFLKNIVNNKTPFLDIASSCLNINRDKIKGLRGLTNHTACNFRYGSPGFVGPFFNAIDQKFIKVKSRNIFNVYSIYFKISLFLFNRVSTIKNNNNLYNYMINSWLKKQEEVYGLNPRKYIYFSNKGVVDKSHEHLVYRKKDIETEKKSYINFGLKNKAVSEGDLRETILFFYYIIVIHLEKNYKKLKIKKKEITKLSLVIFYHIFKNYTVIDFLKLNERFQERYAISSNVIGKIRSSVGSNETNLLDNKIIVDNFGFKSLNSNDLVGEGEEMDHCVGGYDLLVSRGLTNILSVKPTDEKTKVEYERSTLEIDVVYKNKRNCFFIIQNKAVNNKEPTIENKKACMKFVKMLNNKEIEVNEKRLSFCLKASSLINRDEGYHDYLKSNVEFIINNMEFDFEVYKFMFPKIRYNKSFFENLKIIYEKIQKNDLRHFL